MRILSVVETQFVARNIREILENLEYQDAELVLNASEAFDILSKESFDLIIMDADWLKPGIDSHAFIRQVRGKESLQSIPILLCSSKGTADDIKSALQAGANGYLLKPYGEEGLKEHIEKLVGRTETVEG